MAAAPASCRTTSTPTLRSVCGCFGVGRASAAAGRPSFLIPSLTFAHFYIRTRAQHVAQGIAVIRPIGSIFFGACWFGDIYIGKEGEGGLLT